MALVTCRWCEAKSEKTEMIQESNKKYYHKTKCHNAYLQDKEYKVKEREQQTELAIKIADVHGLESYQLIPSSLYPLIEDIRNDSQLFGKLKKNYKKGIPYSAIAYTYEFCREKIAWAKSNKEFKNKLSELKYGLAIVRNNLADAKEHAAKTLKQKQNNTKMLENIDTLNVVNEKIKNIQSSNTNRKQDDKPDVASLFD